MKDFKILDCTLRDGSYVNRFQFTASDTEYLCRNLEKAGIKYIEVGHGLGLGAYRKGNEFSAAADDKAYIKAALKGAKKAKTGVFCIPGIATLDDIELAASCGIDFIRIGSNVNEIEASRKYVEKAKAKGLTVCANYMKSYAISPSKFAQKAKLSKAYGVDYLYIVDSAGGMLKEELIRYIRAVKDNVDIEIGYHGHDNLGLAVSNSIEAMNNGASLIDTSLQGMGRSAGNASTEQVVLLLERMGINLGIDKIKILDLGFNFINSLISQTGKNPIDMVSGFALFHSSYIPIIRKYSNKYCVDPRMLIIELCKVDQINADPALVDKIASKLKRRSKEVFLSKYHLERYFVNEQGQ